MNPLAFVTAVGLACAVIAAGVAIMAFVVEPRRRQRETASDAELPEPREDRAEPAGVWIELAEQRRELDALRDKVARLEDQPR